MPTKKRALLSVSDKTGIVDFAKNLVSLGYEIISTGGTQTALEKAGVTCINISDVTGFPECLDGRVKTLDPHVFAGILAMRGKEDHMNQLEKLKIDTIDVVAVNLYPFKATISKPGVSLAEAVENIDIGGPSMIRAAAKNYQDVLPVVDPADYPEVIARLKGENGGADKSFRLNLMYKIFAHTAQYDSMISEYMRKQLGIEFPNFLTLSYEKRQDMRYGENPHQNAAFYREAMPLGGALSEAVQLNGKELSYNNINDANGALMCLLEFDEPAVVAVKHANPCGVGTGKSAYDAYMSAYTCDPTSIFGGIVAVNRKVDKKTAEEMVKIFLEIVIAPDYDEDALTVLSAKANLRVLKLDMDTARSKKYMDAKKVYGGLLVQDGDLGTFRQEDVQFVTKAKPTDADMKQLEFAFKVVKHVKSNAIALAKDHATIGIGGGQTNRIWACQQAIEHAGERVKGAYLASDAFFPFPDCVEECAKAGIKAIIQPGGSKNDADSIAACDKHGIAMVFVGQRHFRH